MTRSPFSVVLLPVNESPCSAMPFDAKGGFRTYRSHFDLFRNG